MDGKRGRDDLVPECPENKSTAWDEPPPPDTTLRGGVVVLESKVTATRTAGGEKGNRHPAVPARSRLRSVLIGATLGGAAWICPSSSTGLVALRNPPSPLSDDMRRVSLVRLGTTIAPGIPWRLGAPFPRPGINFASPVSTLASVPRNVFFAVSFPAASRDKAK